MTQIDQENLLRFLIACRHDVAHLRGWTAADNETWAREHLTEGVDRYLGVYREVAAQDGEGAAETALAAIKTWAQG